MPKDAQEVTIYELRRPLKKYFDPPPPTSPYLQHAAIIIEVKKTRNSHTAYLLQADLDNILERIIFGRMLPKIKAEEVNHVAAQLAKQSLDVTGILPLISEQLWHKTMAEEATFVAVQLVKQGFGVIGSILPLISKQLWHKTIAGDVNSVAVQLLKLGFDVISRQLSIIEQNLLKIKAEKVRHGTVQSLIHGFDVISKRAIPLAKEINVDKLDQIQREFNRRDLGYYPFNYSAHPIQHKNKIYGINCFGFKEHVLIQLGVKTYTEDEVSRMDKNPLEPHVPQLVEPWATVYKALLLLRGGKMPFFKPPEGPLASKTSKKRQMS